MEKKKTGDGFFAKATFLPETERDTENKAETAIEDMLPYVVSAKIGDCTNVEVLKTFDIPSFDTCFVQTRSQSRTMVYRCFLHLNKNVNFIYIRCHFIDTAPLH